VSVSDHQHLTVLEPLRACQAPYAGVMPLAEQAVHETFAAGLAELTRSTDFASVNPRCGELPLLANLTQTLIKTTHVCAQMQGQRIEPPKNPPGAAPASPHP